MHINDYKSAEMRHFTHLFEGLLQPNKTLIINYKMNPLDYRELFLSKFDKNGYIHKGKKDFVLLGHDICPDWIDIEHNSNWVGGINWQEEIPDNKRKYDLMIAELPHANIAKALTYLSDVGQAIFLTPARLAHDLQKKLPKSGFNVRAIIKTPYSFSKLYQIATDFCLVIVSKEQVDKVFYVELPENNGEDSSDTNQRVEILSRYFEKTGKDNLVEGIFLPLNYKFHNFNALSSLISIEKLESFYKEFKHYSIEHLAIEINPGKTGENFIEKDNSIYIPKLGTSPVISAIAEGTLKNQNYHQIVLKDNALNEYVCCFYKSKIGKLSLETIKRGVISTISRGRLSNLPIALPDIETQKKIVAINKTLNSLQNNLDLLKEELAVNPMNVSSMEAIEDIALTISGLTSSDNLRSLILTGESKTVEFKETFSLDVKTKQKEKYIERASLKTINGFLNAKGGKLFIGVNDSQEITGIDEELKKFYKGNHDNYLLHFKNRLDFHISLKFADFIEYNIIQLDGKDILLVECLESPRPCFFDKIDFFMRTNPATVKLEGEELQEYIANHFKSN